MSLKRFKKVTTRGAEEKKLDQVQTNLEEVLNPVINSVIIDGVLVKDINLDSSKTNLIEHKLGRAPIGWIVVRKRQDSRIWDTQDSNVSKKRLLAIECSSTCQVDLWVF